MIFGRDDKLKCVDIALSEFESVFPLVLPFVVNVTSGHIDEKSLKDLGLKRWQYDMTQLYGKHVRTKLYGAE